MKLLISLTSPYARSVRMTLSALDLDTQIEQIIVDNRGFDEALLSQNPIAKVPTLVLADGTALYDSRVIIEYLFELAGVSAPHGEGTAKYKGLTAQSLALAMMDCTIAAAVEKRNHPQEHQNPVWIERQENKVRRALKALEDRRPALLSASRPAPAQIVLASALGYLDFLKPFAWHEDHPRLTAWLTHFAQQVPSYNATLPPVPQYA